MKGMKRSKKLRGRDRSRNHVGLKIRGTIGAEASRENQGRAEKKRLVLREISGDVTVRLGSFRRIEKFQKC